jgi:3',5'-cyclic AMP phosphodiesterase CpdA
MPFFIHSSMDRRSFVKRTLLAGAAMALPGCRTVVPGPEARRELRLAFLSDIHIAGDRQDTYRGFRPHENLWAAVSQVIETRPEAMVFAGDNARLEGKPEDYQALRGLLEPALSAAIPMTIGLGNHDDRANFLKALPKQQGLRPTVEGKLVAILEHDLVRVVVLDSLLFPNKTPGLLGFRQRDWLANYLPRIADRPAVLVVHHTLGQGDGDLLDADRLMMLARRYRHVKAIVYGHSHVWQLGEHQGLKLVNLPALAYNFRDQDPVGWVEARFVRNGVALTLHAIGGFRGDSGKTTFLSWS